MFSPLAKAELLDIAQLLIGSVQKRAAAVGVSLSFSDAFLARVVGEGYNRMYGARPLRRAVQRLLEDTLAECLIDGFLKDGDAATVDVQGEDGIVLRSGGKSRQIEVLAAVGIESGAGEEVAPAVPVPAAVPAAVAETETETETESGVDAVREAMGRV